MNHIGRSYIIALIAIIAFVALSMTPVGKSITAHLTAALSSMSASLTGK